MIFDPSAHEFVWDDLDLHGENEFDGHFFRLDVLHDGMTLGSPEPMETWVRAMLLDGSIGVRTGDDNRTVAFTVKVSADTGPALQAGETALRLTQAKSGTTAVFTPPDADSVPTAFDVLMARMRPSPDWSAERRLERYYSIEWVCHPFARSLVEVYDEALPAATSAAANMVDDCTSTTTWSSPDGSVFLTGSGQAVAVTKTGMHLGMLTLTKTASIDLSDVTRPYLRVKWSRPTTDATMRILASDGNLYDPVASQSGYSWFQLPAAVYTSLQAIAYMGGSARDIVTRTLKVWSLERSSATGFGTRRELARALPIRGSARTMGRLVVSHPSVGLGNVLVYTYPDGVGGYAPPLAQYRTGPGSPTLDTSTVTGGREPLNGTPTYVIPADALPAGFYRIVARLRHTSAATISVTWNASAAGSSANGTTKVPIAAPNTWQFATLDGAHLPPVRLTEDSDKTVTLTLTTSAGSGVEIDGAWLLHESGVVSIVAAGSELSLTLESASPASSTPRVWVGDHYPGSANILAPGQHDLTPTNVQTHVITDGCEDASLGLYHFPRWFTYAGE